MRIGVRELRQNASRYLDRVKSGETVEVTERGQLVAVLLRPVPGRTTVTWTTSVDGAHTVTAPDTSFGSQTLNKGQTFTQKFLKLGRDAYSCTIHPFMKGTITVVLPYGKG